MTPFSNASSFRSSPSLELDSSDQRASKNRGNTNVQSLAASTTSVPYGRVSPSASTLFASTTTPPGSRSISPNGGLTTSRLLQNSVFTGVSTGDKLQTHSQDGSDDLRQLIVHAYVPHIAVYSSADTDELMKDKGFSEGLWQLLRPYGEHVHGKVTIRDSIGASRVCDDFSVRFVQLGDGLDTPATSETPSGTTEGNLSTPNGKSTSLTQSHRTGGEIDPIEIVVDRHLAYAENFPADENEDSIVEPDGLPAKLNAMSAFYTLYLRRLLSGIPLAPHETFSHPVACIIAISSRNPSPIEELRRLYDTSSHGEKRLPLWVNGEYLRYYVLVHDEERDNITTSMTLFEQMKRHFGLHCHLLRLRSSQCVATDDDSIQLPRCEWISASEELADIQLRELQEGVEDTPPCIYESDATAIKTFIREMVTQSVVPSMERCVTTWNDQIMSKRKGISGRFISLSKKWTGFGSGSRSTGSGTSTPIPGSNSNYDTVQGFYRPDTPEALMRKLADYAFMLRDWKLAQVVYDTLRMDFNNDKAWKYHAAANEMAAISTLLALQLPNSKVRPDTVDQMLDTAAYSYITRCSAQYGALRCLALGMELLRLRGGPAADDAAKWGSKIMEVKLVGSIGDALVKERVAACYASRKGVGSGSWGSRTRKAALWNVLAVDQWLGLGIYNQAEHRMSIAKKLYNMLVNRPSLSHFSLANEFVKGLERELLLGMASGHDVHSEDLLLEHDKSNIDEESEALDIRSHRKSLIGPNISPFLSTETASLQEFSELNSGSNFRDEDLN